MNLETQVKAFFKFESLKVDESGSEIEGSRRVLADWFPNLITNQGLDRLGLNDSFIFSTIHVGSGSTAPAFTDTQLQSFVAGVTTQQGVSSGNSSSAPWYGYRREIRRFSAGVAAGNLSEVGAAWQVTNGGLFSRALIVDSMGNPTTITVLGDEILDVTYELRYYAPVDDLTGSIVLDGQTYSWVSRARNANSAWQPGNTLSFSGASFSVQSLTAVTASPNPNVDSTGTPSTIGYTNGSYAKSGTTVWGLTLGNNGACKTLLLNLSGCQYQLEFTPAIPKNLSRILTLSFRASWARRP